MSPIKQLGISDSPLPLSDIYASVCGVPEAGGIALFAGVVRAEDDGRPVTELRYSAHPSAEISLREVIEKAISRHSIQAVSAVHRVGHLKVGDTAVIVAVACRGRKEAFTACHEIIDDLKATVPIWKDQRFADGGAEWVGMREDLLGSR